MKQQTYGHKPGIIVLIFAMMVFLLLPVSAENHWNNVITEIFVSTSSGETPPGGVSVNQWQEFRLNAKFELPNNQVKAGDKTIFTLPNELGFARDFDFPILAPDGITVVAQAHADAATKKLTITYTDYPEHHSNVTGEFYIYTYVDYTVVTQEQNVPITIIMEDGTVIHDGEVHYNGPAALPNPVLMHKNGWMMDNSQDHYHTIHINQTGQKISNAVLVDELQEPLPGVTYVRNTLTVKKGTWYADGSEWKLKDVTVISNPNVTWGTVDLGEGKTRETFRLELGDIAETEGYMVNYQVRINYEPSDGEAFHNKAKLSGDEIETVEKIKTITVKIAGGSAQGYVFKIQIFKTDEDNTPLAGAKFDVIRVRNNLKVGDITTAANGMGELGNLLQDRYKLVETEAPDGCMPLTEPIFVEIDDFDENKIALKEIVNKRIEKISIPVTKSWVGPVAGPVTVQLKADGQDTGKTLTLSADNNWSGRFTDLPKYAADGHEIIYTVEEVNPPTGYTPSVVPDLTGGFTVTNKNTETIDIPVSKKWIGPGLDKVVVQLWNRDDMQDEVELSTANGWQHTFTGLPKYTPGSAATPSESIEYWVEEVVPEGYAAEIDGTMADGFTITNTNTATVSIPVEKKWIGVAGTGATVTLLADGVERESQTLNAANGWQYTFANLPRYDGTDGHEIVYTIREATIAGYGSVITGNATTGFTVTNTYQPDTTDITAQKVWAGGPAEHPTIWMQLYREVEGGTAEAVPGADIGKLENGNLALVWSGLPRTDINGKVYTYTVKEVNEEGEDFTPDGYVKEENGLTVTNTFIKAYAFNLKAEKRLTGRDLKDAEFSFVLKDEANNLLQTKKNTAGGGIVFDAITLAKPGTYRYTVSETKESLPNVTCDTAVYTVIVEVKQEGAVLTGTIAYEKDGQSWTGKRRCSPTPIRRRRLLRPHMTRSACRCPQARRW